MTSKNIHVQDNSVLERRLRPIYESLDSGNNKKALQECEKVLKKTSTLQCAKALKALALLRMSKETECCGILESLTKEKPSDDGTLQAMTLCYRELQQLNKICSLYETAVKVDPTNEELHTHLFMSYVRVSDFKMQQQTAMTLYKLKSRNPYYCWAVMSVILQATRGAHTTDPQKKVLLLSLAERMIDKLINENKLEAEQEAQLYVMVLELQGKHAEILKVLDGPLGSKLLTGSLSYSKLPYYIKLNMWREVHLHCKAVLAENLDRWNIWKDYINSVFHLMCSQNLIENNHVENHVSEENDLEMVDDTPEKAHEFICRLVENGCDNGFLLRGPYLARFELCSKLYNLNFDTMDLLGETVELFIEYFRKFGHKSCCVSDLRCYLHLLNDEEKIYLSEKLLTEVGISATTVPESEPQMQRHICALELSRLCGNHMDLSIEHLTALVTALSLHYQHGYQAFGRNLLPTDQGPSDRYALLATHILYDLAQLTQNSSSLILGIILLDKLLKNSPNNFHAKLLTVKLYHLLGGGLGAHSMYNNLDIKHIQLDSLGYIHCGLLQSTGLLGVANILYDTTLKFFSSNYKDSSDHITFSYKFGSFLKLEEFMDFRERLNNSLHYTTIAIDRIMLGFVQCTTAEGLYNVDISPKDNSISWDDLRDNRDLSVYMSWDPEKITGSPENSEDVKILFEQDVYFLKLRSQILWSLSAATNIVKSMDGVRDKNINNLRETLKEWEEMYKKISEKNYTPIPQVHITSSFPSRLHQYLDTPCLCILHQLLTLVLHICIEEIDRCDKIVESVIQHYKEMNSFIQEVIDDENKSTDRYWNRRSTLQTISNYIEVISISTLICTVCNDLTKPQGKRGRRKAPESKNREPLLKLFSDIQRTINNFDDLLGTWNTNDEKCDLFDRLNALNLNEDDSQKEVLDHLKSSLTVAVKELRSVLKSKSKCFNSLLS